MIQAVQKGLVAASYLRRMDCRYHLPALAEEQCREKRRKLTAITQCVRYEWRDRPIQVKMVASAFQRPRLKHQLEQLDVAPDIFVAVVELDLHLRRPVQRAA